MDVFVVRLWAPADGVGADTDVRGVVRHVASGTETPFRGSDALLALLRPRHRPPWPSADRSAGRSETTPG